MKDYTLCCVSIKPISDIFLSNVEKLMGTFSITLKQKKHFVEQDFRALDLHLNVDPQVDVEGFKIQLMDLSNQYLVDVALLPLDESRSNKKLIVFDMDSTLIQHEVIDEMAIIHGIGEKVKIITDRAMNGELDFNQSLIERVNLLKGMERAKVENILANLKLTEGAHKLISEVKSRGYKTAIVSGGFRYFAEAIKEKLGMDYAFANELEWEDDKLSGNLVGKIINAEEKANILEALAKKENLTLDRVVAVGDGAHDFLMLAKAGFGIAFHAKEKVRLQARYHINHGPMSSILYFLDIPGNHFE